MKIVLKNKNGQEHEPDLSIEEKLKAETSDLIVLIGKIEEDMRFFRYAGISKSLKSGGILFEEVDAMFVYSSS